jgi:ribonuclease Z
VERRVKITLLGTGSPLPDPHRAGPATLVQTAGVNVLVDCGRGVVMRLAAAGMVPGGLHAVLLTHLHSDHVTDLNDVITTHWVMAPQGAPLRIVGPVGTRELVDAALAFLRPDVGYRLAHHADLTWFPAVEVTELHAGDSWLIDAVTVRAAATDHRPVEPTLGYRIEGDGRSVVLGGDGVPCAGLDELCAGADAYVQSVIRADLVRAVPNARFHDVCDYHSTVADAARTASRAGVAHLVLTHYVPPVAPGGEGEWVAEAGDHFTGAVIAGPDLTTLELS